MSGNTWRNIVVVLGVVAAVAAAPVTAQAQAAVEEDTSFTNVLAGVTAILGSLVYAPFKAVLVCPFSAVGAGATWLATGGEASPADRVLRIGCEGDYFVTRSTLRGRQEFRQPDAPEEVLEGPLQIRYGDK
jgi:hypothetical protein